jgi:HK97 family phage portal protein
MPNLITKVKSFFGGAEGSWRGQFFGQEGNQWFPLGSIADGFQQNLNRPGNSMGVAALQSAISCYTNAFMLMPPRHVRDSIDNGIEEITTSALSRWLDKPNAIQTRAEFWQSGIRQLYEAGNAVGVASRNDRFEVVSVMWASHYSIYSDKDSGETFYTVSFADGSKDPEFAIPVRDIMHLRINVDVRDPLRGRSPIVWCAASLSTNSTLSAFLVSYLNNRASPSYALTTDEKINSEQIDRLRVKWDEQSKKLGSGGTPILSNGLKPVMLGTAPGDALLVDTFNLTVEDISRAFSIPRALLGVSETAANAENLMRQWVSMGLGAIVEMVEQSIEKLFETDRRDAVEFDSEAMLRMDAESRTNMVAKAVVSGVMSPDEGRAVLGLPPVEGGYGAMPTQQQQQVPLDLLHDIHAAAISSKLNPPTPPAQDQNNPPQPNAEDTNKAMAETRKIIERMLAL